MAGLTHNGESHENEIRMWPEGDRWVITDVETGVITQGATRQEVLKMLKDAVAVYNGECGHEPADEEPCRQIPKVS